MEAFRGEVERALSLCADYLVLHPGSFRGADREQGLLRTAAAIAASTQGLDLAKAGLTILIENTAGAEFSLGGSFEQVAEVIERLRRNCSCRRLHRYLPHACRRIRHRQRRRSIRNAAASRCDHRPESRESLALQRRQSRPRIEARPPRANREGKHRARRRSAILLNDLRLAHAAFIAETPIEKPGDDRRNVDSAEEPRRRDVACYVSAALSPISW